MKSTKKLTTEIFINRSKEKHGDFSPMDESNNPFQENETLWTK